MKTLRPKGRSFYQMYCFHPVPRKHSLAHFLAKAEEFSLVRDKKLKSLFKKNNLFYFLASVFVFILILFFAGIYLFSLAKSGQNLIMDIINNKPQNFAENFASWQKKTKYFKTIQPVFT